MKRSSLRCYFLIIGILLSTYTSHSQSADWIITPEINNREVRSNYATVVDTQVDSLGNVYSLFQIRDTISIDGQLITSVSGSNDILLLKTDSYGQILWINQLGGSFNDYGGNIAFFRDELKLSMYFVDTTNIDGIELYINDGSVAIVSLDPINGQVLDVNQKKIHGTAKSLVSDGKNNLYLAGLFTTNSSIGSFVLPNPEIIDIWGNLRPTSFTYLAKLDANLDPIWVEHSTHGSCCVTPRFKSAKLNPITGEIVMIGYSAGAINFNGRWISGNGFFHSYIVSFDKNGQVRWANKAESTRSSGSLADVIPSDFDFDANGNIYLTGQYDGQAKIGSFILEDENESGYNSGFVAKLDLNGQFTWAKAILGGRSTSVASVACLADSCYISGSFRNYLKLDSIVYEDTISSVTRGFIAKVNPENHLNKVLIAESTGLSAIGILNRYTEPEYLMSTGNFYWDVELGCKKVYGNNAIPFVSKLNLTDEVETPVILGNAELCDSQSYFLEIDNFDPNLEYTFHTNETISSIKSDKGLFEIKFEPGLSDTLGIFVIASNECNWRAISNTLAIKHMESPLMLGEISVQKVICIDDKEVLVKVDPIKNVDLYHWNLPDGLSANGQSSLSTQENQIRVQADYAFNSGSISVFADNECGISEVMTREVDVLPLANSIEIKGGDGLCPNEKNRFIAATDTNLTDQINYSWTVSDGLKINNTDSKTLITTANEIIVKAVKSNSPNEFIEVRATNACFQTEVLKYLTVLNEPRLPKINIDECDHKIEINDASEELTWYYNGEVMENPFENVIVVTDSGTYKILSSNACGSLWSEPIEVDPIQLNNVFIPNVITPNGDGKNDQFIIDALLNNSYLGIVNRWGKKVFESSQYLNDWPNAEVNNGIYFYTLRNKCLDSPIQGSITILSD